MPTQHTHPPIDETKAPTRDEILARGLKMHQEKETGGRPAQPQTYGAAVSDKAADVINGLMKKLPPAAVQFFVDHAIQQNLIDQLRIILGADANTDLLAWARGIMGIQEDERARWNAGLRDMGDPDRANRALGYTGGDRFETQRALTSGDYGLGDPEKILDTAFAPAKITREKTISVLHLSLMLAMPEIRTWTLGERQRVAGDMADSLRKELWEHFE